jgi:opacity protein-like surface antigen
MKRLLIALTMAASLALPLSGGALADDPHTAGTTGRPNQSCQATNPPDFPGNTANAPGSAFNGTAGSKYAGSQPQNSQNGQAAQYDVACFQQSQH